ncbi:MAG: hypothetical protein M2R45_05498 [Verrucomicrobia subdivision 3 bacterium]|nr:hypothetical protein [Limisphaerales bacterium]
MQYHLDQGEKPVKDVIEMTRIGQTFLCCFGMTNLEIIAYPS